MAVHPTVVVRVASHPAILVHVAVEPSNLVHVASEPSPERRGQAGPGAPAPAQGIIRCAGCTA